MVVAAFTFKQRKDRNQANTVFVKLVVELNIQKIILIDSVRYIKYIIRKLICC